LSDVIAGQAHDSPTSCQWTEWPSRIALKLLLPLAATSVALSFLGGALSIAKGGSSLHTESIVPAVNPASFEISVPAAKGQIVGTVKASNNPSHWSIVSQSCRGGNPCFAIDDAGVISLTQTGAAVPGTESYLLEIAAANDAGLGVPMAVRISAYADGSAKAPNGVPQHPHLLDLSAATNENGVRFATRPPWKVAGVDYRTGINAGIVLTDPVSSPPNGCVADTLHKAIRCGAASGSTIVDGYDFSLHDGYGLYIIGKGNGGGNPVTIRNSKLHVGSNQSQPVHCETDAGFLTVEYNEIDGGGAAFASGPNLTAMITAGRGGSLIQYNWVKNVPSDFGNIITDGTHTVQFNFAEGLGFDENAHADFVQQFAGPITGPFVYFNTEYVPAAVNGLPTGQNSMFRTGDQQGTVTTQPVFQYNTGVGIGHNHGRQGSRLLQYEAWLAFVTITAADAATSRVDNPIVTDNYVYATRFQNFAFYSSARPNHVTGQHYARNINMFDASTLNEKP
jgi:hypothetical protein